MIFALSRLFGANSHLSSLERLILDCVRNGLDDDSKRLWDMQVKAINKIQRLPKGVEVNFYRMIRGRPSFDKEISFSNNARELMVAEVRIHLPNVREALIAEVWCVDGFLSSIEYNTDPAYFSEAAGMEPRPEFSLELKMENNLAVPDNADSGDS